MAYKERFRPESLPELQESQLEQGEEGEMKRDSLYFRAYICALSPMRWVKGALLMNYYMWNTWLTDPRNVDFLTYIGLVLGIVVRGKVVE